MAVNPRRIQARLQAEVYDKIPRIACKMLCQTACSVIPCSVAEANAMERESGEPLAVKQGLVCSMLGSDGGCVVYSHRPTICRLYGVTEGLECPFGCVPEAWLSRAESTALLERADSIGGVNKVTRLEQFGMLEKLHAVLRAQGDI